MWSNLSDGLFEKGETMKVKFFCWQPGELGSDFADRVNRFIADKEIKWVCQSESGDGNENWNVTVAVWYKGREEVKS